MNKTFLIFFFATITNHSYALLDKQPRWDENLNFDSIETMLAHEEIKSKIPIRQYLQQTGKDSDFDNDVYLITLNNNLKAVFKPEGDKYAEVAAYKASKLLEIKLVPPTVLRTIDGVQGSLQFFVESDIDLLKDRSLLSQLDPHVSNAMKLFYFIFGQWDINTSNQIIQQNNGKLYLALIDNAGMANPQQVRYGDFPFVCVAYDNNRNDDYSALFQFENPMSLKHPTLEQLRTAFSGFFPVEQIDLMWNRYKRQTITYCIWRNALWIQFYKGHPNVMPNYVDNYDETTIEMYKKLTEDSLKNIWAEALTDSAQTKIQKLINLTLERRNQIMRDYEKHL
jgi:hypothetical protein